MLSEEATRLLEAWKESFLAWRLAWRNAIVDPIAARAFWYRLRELRVALLSEEFDVGVFCQGRPEMGSRVLLFWAVRSGWVFGARHFLLGLCRERPEDFVLGGPLTSPA